MNNHLPLYADVDVIVCGGGTAGTFAAIAAAEQGKTVLIVEQFGSLGGTATNGLVTPVMSTGMREDPPCSYIQPKVLEKLQFYAASDGDGKKFDPLVLKLVLEELCVEAGVKILYHTYIAGVVKDGDAIAAIRIVNKAGEQLVKGRVFIDATGDGDVSVMAGAAYTKGNPRTGLCQAMSLRYVLGGVDLPAAGAFLRQEQAKSGLGGVYYAENVPASFYAGGESASPWALSAFLDAGVAAGELEETDRVYFQVFTIPGRADGLAFNCPEFFENIDGTNPDDLTLTQLKGKRAIFRQLAYFKAHFPGFQNAYVAEIAPMVGVRESREIQTEYVLTAKDLLSRRKFEDMICQSNYPVDVHGDEELIGFHAPADEAALPWYDIPYRSIVVKGVDNLLVAGRCLGAEFLVQSSLRVQQSARACGEAAGIAAAMAVDKGVPARAIGGADVREVMISLGARYQYEA